MQERGLARAGRSERLPWREFYRRATVDYGRSHREFWRMTLAQLYGLDAAYTYFPTYDQVLREYNRAIAARIPAPSQSAVAATVAYCGYVHRRHGRFPACTAPFRTVIGFQVCRVDGDFYGRFYRPEALSEAVRESTAQAQRQARRGEGQPE